MFLKIKAFQTRTNFVYSKTPFKSLHHVSFYRNNDKTEFFCTTVFFYENQREVKLTKINSEEIVFIHQNLYNAAQPYPSTRDK